MDRPSGRTAPELVGELESYRDIYRLCYVRSPAEIMKLARGGSASTAPVPLIGPGRPRSSPTLAIGLALPNHPACRPHPAAIDTQ